MKAFVYAHKLELWLMANYVALLAKSIVTRDPGRSLYWLGAVVLMSGVLLMGAKR